jgi:predicted acyl esterase
MTVIGDIVLELHVASDSEDTDFIARLCVETDDGAVTCLTQGQQRCRFRDDPAVPEPLAPNRRDCRCRWGRRRTPFRWAAASCYW